MKIVWFKREQIMVNLIFKKSVFEGEGYRYFFK